MPLPDDGPDAVSTLCSVLHNNTDALSLPADAVQVIEFVMALDKNDCMKSSKFFLIVWLAEVQTPPIGLMANLLAISHGFNDETGFRRFSSMLLSNRKAVEALRNYQKTAADFPVALCGKSLCQVLLR